MTDPISTAQTQTTPQTTNPNPELDFSLNLPENQTIEEPAISLDFSQLETNEITPTVDINSEITPTLENPVQATETATTPEIATPETTIQETTAPIIEDTTTTTETPVQETTTEEIPTFSPESIQPKPEETDEKPQEDNRLEQEDALVEQHTQQNNPESLIIEEKPLPKDNFNINEEALNVFNSSENTTEEITQPASEITELQTNEIQTPQKNNENTNPKTIDESNAFIQENFSQETTIQESTKEETQDHPTQNLAQDHAIIQQLEANKWKTTEIPQIQQTLSPATNEVNLDDLLGTTTPVPPPQATITSIPALTGIQGYQANPISQQPSKPINKKILINFIGGIIFLVVGGFMFKTMYPIEFQKLMWSNTTQTTNEITSENAMIAENSLNSGNTSWTAEESLFENSSLENYHSAADTGWNSDFNAYEDIEKTMDNQATKDKLQIYINEWKKYLVLGKKANDKNMTKYGLFLYKKASTLLLDIENWNQITTDELNKQLADFESYLQKLTWTSKDEQVLPQQPTTPTPEEFFWSGNKTETTTNETESRTTESTTTQTQNEVENISWDQNPIAESDQLDW